MRHFCKFGWWAIASAALIVESATASEEDVVLRDIEGREITVRIERVSTTAVDVRQGETSFRIPLAKLSDESRSVVRDWETAELRVTVKFEGAPLEITEARAADRENRGSSEQKYAVKYWKLPILVGNRSGIVLENLVLEVDVLIEAEREESNSTTKRKVTTIRLRETTEIPLRKGLGGWAWRVDSRAVPTFEYESRASASTLYGNGARLYTKEESRIAGYAARVKRDDKVVASVEGGDYASLAPSWQNAGANALRINETLRGTGYDRQVQFEMRSPKVKVVSRW